MSQVSRGEPWRYRTPCCRGSYYRRRSTVRPEFKCRKCGEEFHELLDMREVDE